MNEVLSPILLKASVFPRLPQFMQESARRRPPLTTPYSPLLRTRDLYILPQRRLGTNRLGFP